jgi:catechol 2,3-dioxygenase-like lactoylglutathione lyase family enzyme
MLELEIPFSPSAAARLYNATRRRLIPSTRHKRNFSMNRLHVHVAVRDLAESVRYYVTLFGAEPTVRKDDYAKWMLDDPRVNFAISARGRAPGVDHLGIQTEEPAALAAITARLQAAEASVQKEADAHCCYARSDKTWSTDPSGIRWESFHTHDAITTYGLDTTKSGPKSACGASCGM